MARDYTLRAPNGEPVASARQCSKGQKNDFGEIEPYMHVLSRVGIDGFIEVDEYKNGLKAKFPCDYQPDPPKEINRESFSQSPKSRRRCAFALGNAETNWIAMLTLTYRVPPPDLKTLTRHRTRLLESIRKKYGKFSYGWFLEFQKRGAPHYHVFIGDDGNLGEVIRNSPDEYFQRRNTTVIRGDFEKDVIRWWTRLVRDESSEFANFQHGGIIERMKHEDAAGRYAAKEGSKRAQKHASDFPVKAWWYLSDEIRPVKRKSHKISVQKYLTLIENGSMISTHWDKKLIENLDFASFKKLTENEKALQS